MNLCFAFFKKSKTKIHLYILKYNLLAFKDFYLACLSSDLEANLLFFQSKEIFLLLCFLAKISLLVEEFNATSTWHDRTHIFYNF